MDMERHERETGSIVDAPGARMAPAGVGDEVITSGVDRARSDPDRDAVMIGKLFAEHRTPDLIKGLTISQTKLGHGSLRTAVDLSPVFPDPPYYTSREYRVIDTSHVPMAPLDPSHERSVNFKRTSQKMALNFVWGLMTRSRGVVAIPAIIDRGNIHDPSKVLDPFLGSGTTGVAAREINAGAFVSDLHRIFALPIGEIKPALADYLLSVPVSASESIKFAARSMVRKMSEIWWSPVGMLANVPRPDDTNQVVDPAKATAWLRSQVKSILLPRGTPRTSNP